MSGPLILLTAMAGPPVTVPPPAAPVTAFRPVGGATARSSVSVRILSGARFGSSVREGDSQGGDRRQTVAVEDDGVSIAIETLEFQ